MPDLKNLSILITLLVMLVGAGATGGTALYRVSQVEATVATHIDLRGHPLLDAQVGGLAERIGKLQEQSDMNARNQIRICVAVNAANCEN